MPIDIDKNAYSNLEQQFKDQVLRDRLRVIQWIVKIGMGVYLPNVQPKHMVDYIFVGMEPSFGWADSVEDGEKKVQEEGFTNFKTSDDAKSTLKLLKDSIDRFLLRCGETYHLTDLAKGAIPVKRAGIDREQRYEAWYPLLLEEIDLVGKPGASIIAIGKDVEEFLRKSDLEGKTGQRLHKIMHYSANAGRHWKREAEMDPEGFEAFKNVEFGERGRWPKDLAPSRMQLVFTYYKQFQGIRNSESQLGARQS